MLERQVEAFTVKPAMAWNLVPTTCLMAVAYWMLQELSVKPTQTHFTNKLTNLNAMLRDIALAGHRVLRPNVAERHAHLPAGAVIVFMLPDLSRPGHGCVIKRGLVVGGYNQTDWFKTGGENHQYSEHDLGTDLVWVGRTWPLSDRRVKRPLDGAEYYLYATPQAAALAVLRRYLA